MVRDAALVAGANLDRLIRARAVLRVPRPMLIGASLVATGAVLALAHATGADVRAWMASGQTGLVLSLFDAFYNQDTPAETSGP